MTNIYSSAMDRTTAGAAGRARRAQPRSRRRVLLVLAVIGAVAALGGWVAVALGQPTASFGHDALGGGVGGSGGAGLAPSGTTPQTTTVSPTPGRTVLGVLLHLEHGGVITRPAYVSYAGAFNAALREVRRLRPARGGELEAVIENLHTMAVNGSLTAARLPVLFLTLNRNRQYWLSGPALSYGQRVEFPGSQLIWEYYPGQGIELQQLASFSRADALCTSGSAAATSCRAILSELIPLAVRRGGGLTWEYYFSFDGGSPPWTSAMSQATAVQALADAYKDLGDRSYLVIAHQALSVFNAPPPTGVGVATGAGMRFVQYSFASEAGQEVINAFLQALIGLDDYATVSGDPLAQRLFAEGTAEAQRELPQFNTGAWSLYQPGVEDDLSYHDLVTGFLQQLCAMTTIPLYCSTAQAFQNDLKTPPSLNVLTTQVKAGHQTHVFFTVSKIARVGITVTQGGKTSFLTSASFSYGEHDFAIPALKTAGTYTVQLDATDLAGNYDQVSTLLDVAGT